MEIAASSTPYNLKPVSWYRNEGMSDLYFFEYSILADAWLDKFHDMGRIHKIICKFLDTRIVISRKKLISVFRGAYKTTVLLGFVLWLFVHSIVRKKPISVCYNTATKENAAAFMDDFREMIRECQALHEIYPEIPTDPAAYRRWSSFKVEYKWFKFHVASLDTKQVSRHYTIIINDDLVNDDNAFSDTEREKIKRKWKFQKSIITKYRKFKVGLEIDVGTPFHSRDLMGTLINRIKTYDKLLIPYAIRSDGTPADLHERDGKLTFPEMFTWEDFDDIYEEQGQAIFASQYKLKVVEEGDKLCDEEDLRYWDFPPTSYVRIMVIDPGGTEQGANTPTGITICDFDSHGLIYVMYAAQHWISPFELIKKIEELKEAYDPDDTYVEKEKYSITIADTVQHYAPRLNFSFVEPKNEPKPKRIHRLKQYFDTGRILLRKGMKDLETQLLDYPDCQNKDILDSLAYQIIVADFPKKGIHQDREHKIEKGFEEELEIIAAQGGALREYHDAIF